MYLDEVMGESFSFRAAAFVKYMPDGILNLCEDYIYMGCNKIHSKVRWNSTNPYDSDG